MNDHELYLDRNENLYGPSPSCLKALRAIGPGELSMYSRDFVRGVKSTLSERLSTELGVPEPQLLLSDGSEDMLRQAVHCYLGPGGALLCPRQSWWYYTAMASEVGGDTITYDLRHDGSTYYYDVDQIISQFAQMSPRLIVIGSPNNPTGNSFPLDSLPRLTRAFPGSVVILDEAYHGFTGARSEYISDLITQYPTVLVLRSFSKYFALAGARVGFAAAGKELYRLSTYASRYLGHNRISEALALAALDSTEYYRRIAAQLCEDRERYYDFFAHREGFTCYRSDANFILVQAPSGLVPELRRFLQGKKIHIKFFTEPEFVHCVRITIGTREQNDLLFAALNEFLDPVSSPR